MLARLSQATIVFAAVALAFGWFVWPTLWRHAVERHGSKGPSHFTDVRVRFHRLTGHKQSYLQERWEDGSVQF